VIDLWKNADLARHPVNVKTARDVFVAEDVEELHEETEGAGGAACAEVEALVVGEAGRGARPEREWSGCESPRPRREV